MEFREVLRHRRMVRDFRAEPIDPEVLDRVLGAASRAPSAGFAQGTDLVVLEGPVQTERYWSSTFTPERRASFRWQGLFRAPVLVVVYADPEAYLWRYGAADKAATGLGESAERWTIPYWLTDAAMAVENLLLAAVDEGLGALFFGLFEHEAAVTAELGVPRDRRALGTVALGHPGRNQVPGRSVTRPRRPLDDVVHRGGW